ncbi:DUF2274 domain-containing protein [Bradyrhizobium sp. UFLA01-814]
MSHRQLHQARGHDLKLIAPMLGRFMATDRGFTKLRRLSQARDTGVG